jgi:hypothetical protein
MYGVFGINLCTVHVHNVPFVDNSTCSWVFDLFAGKKYLPVSLSRLPNNFGLSDGQVKRLSAIGF